MTRVKPLAPETSTKGRTVQGSAFFNAFVLRFKIVDKRGEFEVLLSIKTIGKKAAGDSPRITGVTLFNRMKTFSGWLKEPPRSCEYVAPS
jgi:hypothetical protein